MSAQLTAWFTKHWSYFVKNRSPEGNPQCLNTHQIYILPSKFGLSYVLVMFTLGLGAINYQINPAFILVFLMMTLGIISLWESHKNLQGVCIECLPIPDAEEGAPLQLMILVSSQKPPCNGLNLRFINGPKRDVTEVTCEKKIITLSLQTTHRGQFKLPPIKINSQFPFGLCTVWSYFYFDIDFFVYPKAVDPGFWPTPLENPNETSSKLSQTGDDELYDLKSVENPWIQTSHIAWKTSARGQGWYLKRMISPANHHWMFQLNHLAHGNLELKLQQLSHWIQEAEARNQYYGLSLPGKETKISRGEAHRAACLRLLAAYS